MPLKILVMLLLGWVAGFLFWLWKYREGSANRLQLPLYLIGGQLLVLALPVLFLIDPVADLVDAFWPQVQMNDAE